MGVEFGDRGDVAWDGEGAAHDDDFFGKQEGFWVGGGGEGQVGEGPDGDDGDGVGRVGVEEAEDLVVGGGVGGGVERGGGFEVGGSDGYGGG